jgi:hypothetical protein
MSFGEDQLTALGQGRAIDASRPILASTLSERAPDLRVGIHRYGGALLAR